jgi:two-component system chemotaxis response regulator CheY
MKSLLIVDDSKAIRTAIRQIVEPLGFQVCEAADGEEALAHCSRNGLPDGILLDIDMPVMDGLSFLKVIRQNRRFDGSSVVMCTTHNSMEKVSEAIESGANEYVMKPFDEDIIRSKLQAVGLLS